MKSEFYCEACHQRFHAAGREVSWNDALYGSCRKTVADCPSCGNEVGEYRPIRKSRGTSASAAPTSCATGTCPFVRN